jgi:hypothetical protein
MKISYTIGAFNKAVIGERISENAESITVRARDGKMFTIMKRTIDEIIQ